MTKVLIVPDEIADLARCSRADFSRPWNPASDESPSIVRAVLADWLEEQGQREYMVRYLRERPAGHEVEAHAWQENREWVINAIIEAAEKREALLELKARLEGRCTDDERGG